MGVFHNIIFVINQMFGPLPKLYICIFFHRKPLKWNGGGGTLTLEIIFLLTYFADMGLSSTSSPLATSG